MNPFKITIIAISAYMMLAINLFLDVKQFVLPIGLFKPTLFVIAVLSLIVVKKKPQPIDWVLLLWTALLGFSSKFFLDIVINQQAMDSHENIILLVVSIAHIIAYLLLLFWIIYHSRSVNTFPRFLQLLGGVGLFSCLFLDNYLFVLIPAIVWFTGVVLQKNKSEVYYGISLFLVFCVISLWLTGYFFGAESVLNQL